jgi:hypothetical protein
MPEYPHVLSDEQQMIMGTAVLLMGSRKVGLSDRIHDDRRHLRPLQPGLHTRERRQAHKEREAVWKSGGQKGFKLPLGRR